MKTRIFFFLFLILAFGFPNESIAQEARDKISGNWKVDYSKTLSNMSNSMASRLRRMPQEGQNILKDSYKGRIYSFKEDGQYSLLFSNGREYKASWFLEERKTLLIEEEQSRISYFTVENLNSTEIVLKIRGNEEGELLISTLYLKRI